MNFSRPLTLGGWIGLGVGTILAAVGAGTVLAPVCYAATCVSDALRRTFAGIDLSEPFDVFGDENEASS